MRKIVSGLAVLLALSACQTVGGPGSSSYFECGGGTRLKVDYGPRGALVSVNGARPMRLKAVNAVGAQTYERPGHTLRVMGGGAEWTVGRMLPQRCSQVIVPR